MDWFFITIIALFGCLWGSFLNVVIYRLPKTDIAGLRRNTPYTLRYLAFPLSHCPVCKKPIPPWYNIPLLSYLILRGKSKCCGATISWRYPLVELIGGLLCILAVLFTNNWIDMLFVAAFLSLLVVNAAIDWQRFYLLDIISYPLLWLGLLANIDARFALLPDAVLGAAGGYVAMLVLATVFSFILGRRAMGIGDYKFFAALGAWLGWQPLPMVLFIAAVASIVFSALRQLLRGRGRHIPFGPGLAFAGAVMLLFGDEILLTYWQFIMQ